MKTVYVSQVSCKDHLMLIEHLSDGQNIAGRLSKISYTSIGDRFSCFFEAKLNDAYVMYVLKDIEQHYCERGEMNPRPLSPGEVNDSVLTIATYDKPSIALAVALEQVELCE